MAKPTVTKTSTMHTIVRKAPPGKVNTPKVNASTGFSTGTVTTKATKSNPVTTGKATAPGQMKQAAGVQSAKGFTPAATQDPWSTGKIGEFINSAVGQMTGRIPSAISGAMHNKTPVIPYTQKNVQAIQKATRKP